jgi:hypothetical protein
MSALSSIDRALSVVAQAAGGCDCVAAEVHEQLTEARAAVAELIEALEEYIPAPGEPVIYGLDGLRAAFEKVTR